MEGELMLRLFGADVGNICPKNFDLGQKQFKSIFSDFDILAKNVGSIATVASLFGFFV